MRDMWLAEVTWDPWPEQSHKQRNSREPRTEEDRRTERVYLYPRRSCGREGDPATRPANTNRTISWEPYLDQTPHNHTTAIPGPDTTQRYHNHTWTRHHTTIPQPYLDHAPHNHTTTIPGPCTTQPYNNHTWTMYHTTIPQPYLDHVLHNHTTTIPGPCTTQPYHNHT